MLGVDYSQQSVELARRIEAESRADWTTDNGTEGKEVRFEKWDIIQDPFPHEWCPVGAEGFDIVLDKGTFDAISLSGETDTHGRRICESYASKVAKLIARDGMLLVTSCNWTEEELKGWFSGNRRAYDDEEGETDELEAVGRIKYGSFRFGGKEGQTISSVLFRRGDRGR